jgi:TetR/AcrR family transcriptional regulator, regulator of autoinduction and epiphytic fitness
MAEAAKVTQGPRYESLCEAAARVVYQFGYRKTSMEAIAAEAGVSRQTLYLQFRNKETLFHATLAHITSRMLVQVRAIAGLSGKSTAQTLLAIFEVLCRDTLEQASRASRVELLEVARTQEAELFARFEKALRTVVTGVLAKSETMRAWERDGFTARDLASHLLDVSSGVKSSAESLQEYRARMSLAIRIVCERGSEARS